MISGSDFTGTGLPVLAGVVLLGAVVPVVPTGAAVSAAAAYAIKGSYAPIGLLGVLIAGAAGAYAGDVVVYALMRWGGERLSGWLRKRAGDRLEQVEHQLEEHQITTLLISRLIPGGRVPVLFAASVAGYPLQRFVITDLAAASLWSVVYAAIGTLGGSLFPEPWEGVVAAVVIAVVAGAVTSKIRGHNERQDASAGSSGLVDGSTC